MQRNMRAMIPAVVLAVIISVVGASVFWNAQRVMEMQLKERLRSSAALAAEQFSLKDLEKIKGPKEIQSASFSAIVERLKAVRDSVPGASSVYILRYSTDPHLLTFVADADSLRSVSDSDANKNGSLEPDEVPSRPGDQYDVTQAPAMLTGFTTATTDDRVTLDQWGYTISGYAPIKLSGNAQAAMIIGIDMRADEYLFRVQSILPPLAFFFILLGTAALVGYIATYLSRRRLEELQSFDRERAGLMLLTFHQLGAPLTIFKWSLEALETRGIHETPESSIDEHVRNMQQGIRRMDSMLSDLKLAAQVQEERVDMTIGSLDIEHLAEAVMKNLADTAHDQGITVSVDAPTGLLAKADTLLVENILTQLLTNSINYTKRGGKVIIRARSVGRKLQIDVSDDGAGIPPADMKRLFGKFMRGSNAPIFKPDGNGLGLFIAKGLAEAMGGTMWVRSILDRGTTVSFTLPRV